MHFSIELSFCWSQILVVALFLILKPVATAKHIYIHVKSICTFLETGYSIRRQKLIWVFKKNSWICLVVDNNALF